MALIGEPVREYELEPLTGPLATPAPDVELEEIARELERETATA